MESMEKRSEPLHIPGNFAHIQDGSNGCRNQNLEHPLPLLWIIVIVGVPVLFVYWSDHSHVNTSTI